MDTASIFLGQDYRESVYQFDNLSVVIVFIGMVAAEAFRQLSLFRELEVMDKNRVDNVVATVQCN